MNARFRPASNTFATVQSTPITLVNVLRYLTQRHVCSWADKVHGETIPVDGSFFAYTLHEPIGVVGHVRTLPSHVPKDGASFVSD